MDGSVTARELAVRLGVSDKRLRDWLRAQARQGHEVLSGHQHRDGWVFTSAEASRLAVDYRHGSRPALNEPGPLPNALVTTILGDVDSTAARHCDDGQDGATATVASPPGSASTVAKPVSTAVLGRSGLR